MSATHAMIGSNIYAYPATLTVAENSAAAAIDIQAPTTDFPPITNVTIEALPANGLVTLADGVTPVAVGQDVGVTGLTGLEFTPTAGMFSSSSSLSYKVTDSGGQYAEGTETLVIGPQLPPDAPTIAGIAPASDTGVAGDNRTTKTTPVITGAGTAGDTVTLHDGGSTTPVGTAVVGAGGGWAITPTTAFAYGSHTITATQTSAPGNASVASAALPLAIDVAVTGISADASRAGALDVAQTVAFTLTTAAAVQVTGNPTLALSNGGTATYDAAASSGASLVFNYTVATGQDTADLQVSGLSLNGGAIGASGGGLSLAPATSYAVGSYPESVTTADVNGDGKPDLVTANFANNTVSVLLGNGSGGFSAATTYAVGTNPVSVTTADVNGDGKPDLVAADYGGNAVSVLLGDGSGGFGTATSYAAGSNPQSVATADVNGDRNPDLVVVNGASNNVSVLLGDGSGGFGTATSYATGTNPNSVATADLNGDGKPDLVAADYGGNAVSVLLGDGSGGFGAATTYAVGTAPVSVTTADVNGDGKSDIVTANTLGNSVSVLLNSSTPVVTATLDTAGAATANGHDTGLMVDTTAPDMPVITSPDLTDSATPVITGTAEDGSTVRVTIDGATYSTVATGGAWSVDLGAATPATGRLSLDVNGFNKVSATATDAAGNKSRGMTQGLTIDTTAPDAPAGLALAAESDSGMRGDGITNVTHPTITGTGETGDTVTLYESGAAIGTALVADGGWSFTSEVALASGTHRLTARQANPAGNVSAASAVLPVVVYAEPPAAPAGMGLAAGSDSGTPGDGITNVTHPVISGAGVAGDTVKIYNGTTLVGSTTAGPDNTWSFTPDGALADGSYSLTSTQTDPAGNVSAASAPFALTVDATPPAVTAALAANPHDTASTTYNQVLDGGGDPNASVAISDGGTVIGGAQADATGAWSFDLAGLAAGSHSLVASEDDAVGNIGISAAAPLSVAPGVMPDTRFTVASGDAATSGQFFGSDYTGPLPGLQAEYGYTGTDNANVIANVPNVFLYSGTAGEDALVAHGGSNVLDSRGGSDWMIGASGADGGIDNFFVDSRGNGSPTTWDTALNFHVGDKLTIWDFDSVAGNMSFFDNLGQPGYTGATLLANLGNGATDLVTFAGLSSDNAQFVTSTGTSGGLGYLALTRVA